MPPQSLNLDLKGVKKQIVSELHNCNQRGLVKSAKWFVNTLILLYSINTKLHELIINLLFCVQFGLICRLAELNFALNHVKVDIRTLSEYSALNFEQREFYDTYLLCKTYFDCGEYLRYALFYKSICLLSSSFLDKQFC